MRLGQAVSAIAIAVTVGLFAFSTGPASAQTNQYEVRRGSDPRPLPDGDFSQQSGLYNSYKYRNRGMFGPRVQGTPSVDPGKRSMFSGSGALRGPSGNFIGIERDAPNSMFKPYNPSDLELQQASRPAQIVVPNVRVAENQRTPWALLPSAVARAEEPGVTIRPADRTDPQWLRPVNEPPAGEPEAIWMRSPVEGSDTGTLPGGRPQPLAPGQLSGVGPNGAFAFGGPSGGAARQSTPESRYSAAQNQRIAARVATAIIKSPAVRADSPITVAVVDGYATLKGQVSTAYRKTMAGQIALQDPDVFEVRNLLTVPSDSRSAGSAMRSPSSRNVSPGPADVRTVPIVEPPSYDDIPQQFEYEQRQ